MTTPASGDHAATIARDYWDLPDPVSAALVNIKGQRRREWLYDILTGAKPEPEGDWREAIRFPSLSSGFRRRAVCWHPTWLGGEELPDYLPGEVEIARIIIHNHVLDVISIRARRETRGTMKRRAHWVYRMVDEHGMEFWLTPAGSVEPLSEAGLRGLIDCAASRAFPADGRPFLDRLRADMDPDEGETFAQVESLQYPELGQYFAEQARVWAERKRLGLEE
jgi:hypothetical protein